MSSLARAVSRQLSKGNFARTSSHCTAALAGAAATAAILGSTPVPSAAPTTAIDKIRAVRTVLPRLWLGYGSSVVLTKVYCCLGLYSVQVSRLAKILGARRWHKKR